MEAAASIKVAGTAKDATVEVAGMVVGVVTVSWFSRRMRQPKWLSREVFFFHVNIKVTSELTARMTLIEVSEKSFCSSRKVTISSWLLDSGASSNMTGDKDAFRHFEELNGSLSLTFANGERLPVTE
ncbi:hypothetical protein PC128_g5124 [Phytophthora cactorum]|nr:hypothetical protein PC128_g5124 [Phytophthora cactorum]